jgi:hypothetical protein
LRKFKVLATATALMGLLVFAIPQASATVTGAIAFECTASLGAWPTSGGSGTCSGTGVGIGVGVDSATSPFVLAGPGAFNASFTYNELCPVAGAPPALGNATGSATVSNAPAVHNAALTTATLNTNFVWIRVGIIAVITTSGTTVSFANGGGASALAPDAALAVFAPTNPQSGSHLCPQGDPLTALVVGVDAQPV